MQWFLGYYEVIDFKYQKIEVLDCSSNAVKIEKRYEPVITKIKRCSYFVVVYLKKKTVWLVLVISISYSENPEISSFQRFNLF